MTALEFWLMLILYCFLVVIVYKKQLKACSKVLYTSTGEQKFLLDWRHSLHQYQ